MVQILFIFLILQIALVEEKTEDEAFNQKCLREDATADDYFKDVAYQIDLEKLYKIKDTCHYNYSMKFVAVLVEIVDETIKKAYEDYNYLLLVYNLEGRIVFQMTLNYPLKNWAICYNYFIYVTDDRETVPSALVLQDLISLSKKITVTNFVKNSVLQLAYNQDTKCLYTSTSSMIECIQLEESMFSEWPNEVDASKLKKVQQVPGCPIHDLIMPVTNGRSIQVIAVLETSDNQLDFNIIENKAATDDKEEFICLNQQREVVMMDRDNLVNDPIIKTDHAIVKGTLYSCSIRQSQKFDLYYDMMRISSLHQQERIQNASLSSRFFYLFMANGNVKILDFYNIQRTDYNDVQTKSKDEISLGHILNKKIQHCGILISGCYIHRDNYVLIRVVHTRFLSEYNLSTQKFQSHFIFSHNVLAYSFRLNIALLENGGLYKLTNLGSGVQNAVATCIQTLEGKIIATGRSNQAIYVQVENDDKKIALKQFDGKLVRDLELSEAQSKSKSYTFFEIDNIQELGFQNQNQLEFFSVKNVEKIDEKGEKIQQKEISSFLKIRLSMSDTVHSAISYDANTYILFGDHHICVIDKKNTTAVVYKDHNIRSYIKLSNKVFYALSCEMTFNDVVPGVKFYNLDSIVNKNTCFGMLLKEMDIGYKAMMDFDSGMNRIIFIQQLQGLAAIPQLHLSTNRFIGTSSYESFMVYKIIKDRVLAINSKNQIYCWDLVTGKLLSVNVLENQDIQDYRLVNQGYRIDKILLKNFKKYEDDQSTEQEQIQENSKVKDQVLYSNTQRKALKIWKLVELASPDTLIEHITFIHSEQEGQLNIYINSEVDKMIELLQYNRAYIYSLSQTCYKKQEGIKQWQLLRNIDNYPTELSLNKSFIPFYSPDFSLHLDIDRAKNQFVIKDTSTQDTLYNVPQYLMKYDKKKALQKDVMSWFYWIDNSTFKIKSTENVEKIVDFTQNFKELAYNMRNHVKSDTQQRFHYYLRETKREEVLFQLQSKYNAYKSSMFDRKNSSYKDYYEQLFQVIPDCISYYDFSFTFLHWSLMEQLKKGTVQVEDIDESLIETLFYNVLPNGNTVLHYLSNQQNVIIKLLEVAHPLTEDGYSIKFHVPVLPNWQGQTSLHLNYLNEDERSIDIMLRYLSLYGIDHHSKAIKDLIPKFFEMNLTELVPYLDSRMQETVQISQIQKARLKQNFKGIVDLELWFDQKQDLEVKAISEKESEKRVICHFIDIPSIYHYSDPNFELFYENLAKTDNYELFTARPIQRLIEFNFLQVRKFTLIRLLFPFLMFHLFYVLYTNIIFERKYDSDNMRIANITSLTILAAFTTYFVFNEGSQIFKAGLKSYFTSIWNFIDIIAFSGIYSLFIMGIIGTVDDEQQRPVVSTTTLFMWFKLLYFLRIFKNTGYLISMIIQVIYDMRHFFLVMLITICAIGDSMLRLALASENEIEDGDKFAVNFIDAFIYTYRMVLGDFGDFGKFQVPFVTFFFILCTLFNMIVMLNLLIAIISSSYENATSNRDHASYKEMAVMIAENYHLIPSSVIQSYARQDAYLLTFTDLESANQKPKNLLLNALSLQKKEMQKELSDVNKKLQAIETNFAAHQIEIKGLLGKVIEQINAMKDDKPAVTDKV